MEAAGSIGVFASLPELIRGRADERGERLAFMGAQRCWTYRELDEDASRVAQGLAAAGVRAGDTIACLTKHGAECVLLLLGASKLGASLAPLNWRLSAAELGYLMGFVRPKVVVADAFLDETLARVPMTGSPLRLRTDVDGGGLYSWIASHAAEDPGVRPSPDDVAAVLFSSGTTGNPKGVEVTHAGILLHCRLWRETFGYAEDARQLNVLPTFHVSGLVNAVWMLELGAEAVFQPEFDPRQFLRAVAEHRITDAFAVPAMLRALVGSAHMDDADLSSLRSIAYGGSPIDASLLLECVRRFGCRMLQVYGMTEASGTLSTLGSEELADAANRERLLASVGRGGPHVELRVVDPVQGGECADGEVGEVWVRAPHLMRGYRDNPDATTEIFPLGRGADGGWMRTGDAGLLRDGYLFLMDRIKDMVISGGENIYPVEVERVIALHPEVAEVAVIGVPDERWGETVKACIVPHAGTSPDPAGIIAWTRERLAHYKCPTSVDVVAALPRNPSGKVLKRELRKPYWEGRSRHIA